MMWLITSQWVTQAERHVWWGSCASLLNRCVDDKIFCHLSKWRNHGWGELRKPRWEHNKLCPYDEYSSLCFAAVVTHRLYEWQVTRWEGLSLLGLWTLQTITQAQYRGQQSTFGNQVKPVESCCQLLKSYSSELCLFQPKQLDLKMQHMFLTWQWAEDSVPIMRRHQCCLGRIQHQDVCYHSVDRT